MEIEEIHIKNIGDQVEIGREKEVKVNFHAEIENGVLQRIFLSAIEGDFVGDIIPDSSTVPAEDRWELLAEFIEFLQKVLKLK